MTSNDIDHETVPVWMMDAAVLQFVETFDAVEAGGPRNAENELARDAVHARINGVLDAGVGIPADDCAVCAGVRQLLGAFFVLKTLWPDIPTELSGPLARDGVTQHAQDTLDVAVRLWITHRGGILEVGIAR